MVAVVREVGDADGENRRGSVRGIGRRRVGESGVSPNGRSIVCLLSGLAVPRILQLLKLEL